MTIKYLNQEGNSYIEDVNGGIPCVEWQDVNDNTFRAIVIENLNQFQLRKFTITVLKQIKPKGIEDWYFVENYIRIADDSFYRTAATGSVEPEPYEDDLDKPIYDPLEELEEDEEPTVIGYEKKMKEGLVTEAQFFINMVGKNLANIPIALYNFFIETVAIKENLA